MKKFIFIVYLPVKLFLKTQTGKTYPIYGLNIKIKYLDFLINLATPTKLNLSPNLKPNSTQTELKLKLKLQP